MKKLVLVGMIATQIFVGQIYAANLDACEPLTSAMGGNFLALDKTFGLEQANQDAAEFYSAFLVESKKVGLHSKALELHAYRTARHQVSQLGYKTLSQISDAELEQYLKSKKSTPPQLEFTLQDQVKASLAVVVTNLKTHIAKLTAKGYTFEIDEIFSGTVQFKKQVADAKAINYSSTGWIYGTCSSKKSHTQVIMRYTAGDLKFSKHFDRPNSQGCNNVKMGFALMNLSRIDLPENCNVSELIESFSSADLE